MKTLEEIELDRVALKVRAMILNDTDAFEAAIIFLTRRQTLDERKVRDTIHDNDRGWNNHDVRKFRSQITWLCDNRRPHLTGEFANKNREGVLKYTRTQLAPRFDEFSAIVADQKMRPH